MVVIVEGEQRDIYCRHCLEKENFLFYKMKNRYLAYNEDFCNVCRVLFKTIMIRNMLLLNIE